MVGSASARFSPSWDDGRYALGEKLGQGAAGVVYRAVELATGRVVAVKWLRAGATDPQRAQRFAREGEALAGLSHPGIVRVHAGGIAAGRPFLVMELIEGGRTLGPVAAAAPLRRRIELVRDVARALGHAHAQGLVHRDVKPDNVLVDQAGVARVADFGLALGVDQERLTKTGAVLGTPSYMAPEQWDGRVVGPAADVWSLGVVLYELLTGELPFQGDSWVQLLAAQERPPVPPRRRAPDVPARVEAVCLWALRRDPAARPADGEAFALALDACLEGRSGLPRSRLVVALAGLAGAAVLAGVAALGAAYARRSTTTVEPAATTATPPAPTTATASGDAPTIAQPVPRPTPPSPAEWAPPKVTLDDLPVPPEGTLARMTYEVSRANPATASQMAKFYDYGESGVAKDTAIARRWCVYGALSSNVDAMAFAIELVDRNGETGPGERAYWLARIVRAAHDHALSADERSTALYVLATNDIDRRRHLEEAVALNHAHAMLHLGQDLLAGDPTRARALFRAATAQGQRVGWLQLGDLLERGVGGPVDLEQAVACYRRAIDVDDPRGCLALGRLLIAGKGVPRDLALARQLLERAEAHDELRAEARALLARLPPG